MIDTVPVVDPLLLTKRISLEIRPEIAIIVMLMIRPISIIFSTTEISHNPDWNDSAVMLSGSFEESKLIFVLDYDKQFHLPFKWLNLVCRINFFVLRILILEQLHAFLTTAPYWYYNSNKQWVDLAKAAVFANTDDTA